MPDIHSTIALSCPAKLNLVLAVGQKQADGLHPICSWMVAINLYDELQITQLTMDQPSKYMIQWHDQARHQSKIDWSIGNDLAVRAHQAMEKHAGIRLPIQMTLLKQIPVGGGLGGGSSDAAGMLRGLNNLFELNLPLVELTQIAIRLGSDVPFFLHGGSALVEGLGERVTNLKLTDPLHFVLVFPDLQCPTVDVYAAFDELGSMSSDASRVRTLAAAKKPDPFALFNDLTEAAMQVTPQLSALQAQITKLAERQAHVSGSGSTLFVICDDREHSWMIADRVEKIIQLPALVAETCPRVAAILDGSVLPTSS